MRKIISTIVLSLIMILSAYSQTVSVQYLLDKSKCKDFTCYNDFITQEGFSYFKSDKGEGGNWYLYLSDEKFPTSSTPTVSTSNTSIITFNTDGSVTTGFRIAIVQQYNLIIGRLKELGFVSVSIKDVDNAVVVEYQSETYPGASIAVQTDKIGDSETWISYDITVNRLM